MIKFLEALYDPDVSFLIFPFIVGNSSSSLYIFEKKRKRSFEILPSGNFHIFSWGDKPAVKDGIIELICEQNFSM
jgi:hypothetical protein